MVKNGLNGPQATPEEIATLTVTALKRTVPPAIPGIFFLSGEMPLDCDNEEVSSIFKNCDGDFEVINQALTSFTSTPIEVCNNQSQQDARALPHLALACFLFVWQGPTEGEMRYFYSSQ